MTLALDGGIAEYAWLLPTLPLMGAVINGALSLAPRLGRAAAGGIADRSESGSADGSTAGSIDAWEASATLAVARSRPIVSLVGCGVLLASFVVAVAIFLGMQRAGLEAPFVRTYASWMPVGTLAINWGVQIDQLSILMALVITGVGTLIHLFSIGYMWSDPGYARYFAYLNLFVASMLTLVLGSSYPVLFVGWEGVGLCSYLLIGFWFSDRANVAAGTKAFIVNRVGDFGFLVAMFMIWVQTGTLDFVAAHGALGALAGTSVVVTIALFLFLGCAGKSAQLPLYIWLPDAMAGPTPVSALIHAATMVTAGVYLIARASPIFAGAPQASLLVAFVGAVTALFAATIAMRQWDIKKVLAYSTVSQLGYMFMAVGSGAYTAGVFHLVTHAFFKAVLFLGAGSVIHALHQAYDSTGKHEDAQDLRNMGGLAKYMPATAGAMLVATLAIAGIPPLSGFFSKDEILSSTFARAVSSPLAASSLLGIPGQIVLYAVYVLGLLTALLTAVYMTRLVMMAFAGVNRTGDGERASLHEAPSIMTVPVLALAALAVVAGWLNLPSVVPIGRVGILEHWLEPVVGASARRLAGVTPLAHDTELMLIVVAIATSVAGIAYGVVRYRRPLMDKAHSPADTGIAGLLANAYGVDSAVDMVVVRPVHALSSTVLAHGIEPGIDRTFSGSGWLLARVAGLVGRRFQDGDVGKYAWLVAAGAVAMIAALTLA